MASWLRPAVVLLLLRPLLATTQAKAGTPPPAPAIPWGSWNIHNVSCPIVYPYFNESVHCAAVGRQRALVNVTALPPSGVVCATIPWRLRPDFPQGIGAFVANSQGIRTPSRVSGDSATTTQSLEVCFAAFAPGIFAVYYLPYAWSREIWSGSFHSHYLDRVSTPPLLAKPIPADAVWATFLTFESFSPFDARAPLEFAASDAESKRVPAPDGYATWVSLIRNTTSQTLRSRALPRDLSLAPPNATVTIQVPTDEVRAVQVALYAATAKVDGVTVEFLDTNDTSPAVTFTCLQTSGVDYVGQPFTPPPLVLEVGQIGQLLILVDATQMAQTSSAFVQRVRITPTRLPAKLITITVKPGAEASSSSSSSTPAGTTKTEDIWKLSRLSWLNSRVGIDDTITRPYTPLTILQSDSGEGAPTLACRGRKVTLSTVTGLPTAITSNGRNILAQKGVQFVLHDQQGHPIVFVPAVGDGKNPFVRMGLNNASAAWSVSLTTRGGDMAMTVRGRMDYDGHLDFSVALQATTTNNTSPFVDMAAGASLLLSVDDTVARFANGAGLADNGAWFPRKTAKDTARMNWSWRDFNRKTWDPHTPAGGPPEPSGWRLWLGDVDAGLWLKLKGESLAWNEAFPGKVVGPPPSWAGHDGKSGSLNVSRTMTPRVAPAAGAAVTVEARSGHIRVPTDKPLVFNFTLMATPTKGDWTHTDAGKRGHYKYMRHFHVPYGDWNPPLPCDLKNGNLTGLTTYILHASNAYNPYIDWPFHPDVMPRLEDLVQHAASCDVRVKLYYTIGQLTNHDPELFALAGLNGEILLQNDANKPAPAGPPVSYSSSPSGALRGMGGNLTGNEWLIEHMGKGYEGGWFTPNPNHEEDAAIATNVSSRYMNYYIEGQRWLYEELGIGGLYYDGFNAERRVQQRVRRMSEQVKPRDESQVVRFDVHGRAFTNVELLPFVDSMWTCEGIDFTQGPAYWLASISALPFGTFGEMLGADSTPPIPGEFCGEWCANKWRGMLFGMSNRAGWNGQDPNHNAELWELWDAFEIEKANMFGWWNESSPVQVEQQSGHRNRDGDDEGVFATAYVKAGNVTLVAVAMWGTEDLDVTLIIDWAALDLSPETGRVVAPALPGYNNITEARSFPPAASGDSSRVPIPVKVYEGWLLMLSD